MKKTVLMYDCDLKAPGCVMIQAAHGCDTQSKAFLNFSSEHWLVNHTSGMQMIEGTEEQWKRAAEITRKHHNKGNS